MPADFAAHVLSNSVNRAILSRWERLHLPGSWLVAGCLFQTVWNILAGLRPESGIKDYDIFYFDPSDLSETAAAQAQALADPVLGDLGVAESARRLAGWASFGPSRDDDRRDGIGELYAIYVLPEVLPRRSRNRGSRQLRSKLS
jgi:hypothetical protein